MHLRRHGWIVIVGSFDLDLALSMNVNSVQLHTGCRHFYRFEFQEAKSPLVIDVDGENWIFAPRWLFHQRLVDRGSEEDMQLLLRHIWW